MLPVSAKEVVVSLDIANAIARQAFIEKDYKTANKLSYGVLSKRPDDAAALVVVAATDPALGFPRRGRDAAKRAFRLTSDPRLRYEAAFFAGTAAAQEESYTASKYWLRRAYQIAPDQASKNQVSKLFRTVAQRSPLTVQLNFNISPSSNINNGSREETTVLQLFGGSQVQLSVDAQALSGLQYRGAAAFEYKLDETEKKRTVLNFGVDAQYYTLSSSSKADLAAEDAARIAMGADPRNISGSNFSYETVYAGLRQQLLSDDKKSSLSYGFTLGQSWYGGSTLSRFAGVNLGRVQVLSPTRSVQYGISAQRQFRLDNKNNSSNVVTLNSRFNQLYRGKGLLSLGAYVRDTNSRSNEIDNTALGLTLSYRLEKPIFANTQFELALSAQRSEYETSILYGDRRDNRLSVTSVFTFSDINYFGFSPTATLSASRTNSTVSRFSTDSYGVNIGLRSSF